MTIKCAHPEGGEALQPAEIVQAFGPTAGSLIPVWPGYGMLHRSETGASVYLSRLDCGHYLMTSPTTAAAAEKKARDAADRPTSLQVAAVIYQTLLERAHAGADVLPSEVAEAQAAVMVEQQAEAGRQERLEAARIKAEQDHREAVEGPVRDQLAESHTNLQEAEDKAFLALMALLDAVDEDSEAHDNAMTALMAAGFEAQEVRTTKGYVQSTRAAGKGFPYFPKAEHLIAVLHAVQYSRHSNAFTSLNGRDLGRGLPIPIAGGPRVSPNAETG